MTDYKQLLKDFREADPVPAEMKDAIADAFQDMLDANAIMDGIIKMLREEGNSRA